MQPVQIYTSATPNGFKVTIFCEELKRANPDFKVEYKNIDLGKNEQKEDWFLKINPNGRIPALVDPNRNNFNVFESAAILLYLEKHYDPEHVFSWPSSNERAGDLRNQVLQVIFSAHGGIGPMQGQSNHFTRYAPETSHGIDRYQNETKRLYKVLDGMLEGKEWLVGDKYSIADANTFPWLFYAPWAGIRPNEVPKNVKAFIDRMLAREATQAGIRKPQDKLTELASTMWDEDFEEKQSEKIKQYASAASKWIVDGMKADAEKK